MTLLLTQIFLCLLAAALIGAVAAWLYRRNIAARREDGIHQQWKERIRQIEVERDRNVHKLNVEIERQKNLATKSGQSVALADYQNLTDKLEGQVAERENVITELREEIQTLRGELADTLTHAREHEAGLLQRHEQETANLMAQMDQPADQAQLEASLRRQHEKEVIALKSELGRERDQALAELEAALREQHEQQTRQAVDEREAQLREQHEQELAALAGKDDSSVEQALSQQQAQHEKQIAELKSQFEEQERQALSEQVMTLREQHDQELAELKAQLSSQQGDSNQSAHQQYEQEIERLNALLAQPTASGGESADIKRLQAEIQLRDDSIAVLRDDLAALNEARSIDQRGRQDEQLRSAINEATRWQGKYEATAAELLQLKSDSLAAVSEVNPEVPKMIRKTPARKQQVSGGDRIGSVMSHPGGHKDRLQEINGIGPVLERKLNDFGVYHFKQIAEFDKDDIARLSNELGSLAGRIGRDEWVAQAKALHQKYHG